MIPMAGIGAGARRHRVDRAAAAGRVGQLADERPSSAGSSRAATGTDYYELWLTKDGKLADSVRPLHGAHRPDDGRRSASRTACASYDGWVVTRRGSDVPLLATSET